MSPPPRPPEFDAGRVRDVSEAIYAQRLGAEDTAKMLAKVGPVKFRDNAGAYDTLTRAYMRVLGDNR